MIDEAKLKMLTTQIATMSGDRARRCWQALVMSCGDDAEVAEVAAMLRNRVRDSVLEEILAPEVEILPMPALRYADLLALFDAAETPAGKRKIAKAAQAPAVKKAMRAALSLLVAGRNAEALDEINDVLATLMAALESKRKKA